MFDDFISNPHTIYKGSFYQDKELTIADSTVRGYVEQEDYKLWCEKICAGRS